MTKQSSQQNSQKINKEGGKAFYKPDNDEGRQKGLPGTELPNGQIPPPKLPFTMEQIRKAIPQECFKKDLTKSLLYMVRDWAIIAALYYFQSYFFYFGFLGKFVWWNLVGFFMWALFVVAHDCGHGSFSDNTDINFVCGIICNAPILVPFTGWQNSHRKHHSYHNHMDKDQSWTPLSLADYKEYGFAKYIRFSALVLLAYPWYLIKESQKGGFTGNHFNPWSPMFKPQERVRAGISSIAVICFLIFLFKNWSFGELWTSYFIPYLIFVCWLDLVTYLQHTDEKSLFYRDEQWEYFAAAFSTIDRNYGRIVNHFMHNIETHVVHHIFFTQIPHYNLLKATAAVKDMFGEWYLLDESWVPFAFFRSLKRCVFVPDEGQVLKYESQKVLDRVLAEEEKQKQQ